MRFEHAKSSVVPLLICQVIMMLACSLRAQIEKDNIQVLATILSKGKSSFPGVPESVNNMVARVDGILEKPDSVTLKVGDTITIIAKDPSLFENGSKAIFYSRGWIYGPGLAVKELRHETVTGAEDKRALNAHASGAKQALNAHALETMQSDTTLSEHIAEADAVVVGTVTAVRDPIVPCGFGILGISEHNPLCKQAVVRIEDAMKGVSSRHIIIVFPSSLDVAWHDAPRFEEGEEATFILKKDVAATESVTQTGAHVPAYTVLSPSDVLPKEKAAQVRAITREQANPHEK
jgi:hypothetical protein